MHGQRSWEEAALQLAADHAIQTHIRQIFHVLKYIFGAGFITGIIKMGIHQMIVINKAIPAEALLPLPQLRQIEPQGRSEGELVALISRQFSRKMQVIGIILTIIAGDWGEHQRKAVRIGKLLLLWCP